jgi:hypothetical protein
MPKTAKPCTSLLALALTAVLALLAGCGSSRPSLTHIEGSSATTSKATLDHWMRSWAGQDFRASVGTKGPEGLVSEPANYSECVEAAKKVIPRSFTGKLKLTDSQILEKCRQLHNSIKAQALSYVLSLQWTDGEGAEQGLTVSQKLLNAEFARYRKSRYPTEAALKTYLTERHMVLSDVLAQLRSSILVTRILPKFEAKVKKAGGGEKTYVRLALERYRKLIAKTTCSQGYVVPGCREYHGPPSVEPAPNTILEQFVQGRAS